MQTATQHPTLLRPPPDRNSHIMHGLEAAMICVSWLKAHGFEVLDIKIGGDYSRPVILIVPCDQCGTLPGSFIHISTASWNRMRAGLKWCFVEWLERRH